MRRRGNLRLWIAGAVLGGGLACGSADSPEPSGPPLDALVTEIELANRAPVIEAVRLEPVGPVAGDRVRAIATVRDPEGDAIELGHVWTVGDRRVASSGDSIKLANVRKGEWIEVAVTASDGRSESLPVRAEMAVGNQRPRLRQVKTEPRGEVAVGDTVLILADAEDPDGDELRFRYTWRVNGKPVDHTGAAFSTEYLRLGDEIQARVVALDETSRSDAIDSAIVRVAKKNAHPQIVSSPGEAGSEGVFRYVVEARDPDGDRNLRYSLRSGPEGMRVDPLRGEITWQPTPEQAGSHEVEVVVRDSDGAATVQYFEVTVKKIEEPPSHPAAPAED